MNTPNIEKKLLFEKLGYKPHPKQNLIHESTARFVIPCCGRRFGKSQAAGHEITWRMFAPDSYIWIVGPTYKTGEKEFRVVYDDIIRKLRIKGVRKSNNTKQGDMRIEMPWNTILEVVSAEKQDSLVGEGLDYACVSEAALHQMSTWQMYIEPALSDKLGGAIFPSTPRGNNWYRGLFKLGAESVHHNPEYESWRFPTWENTVQYPGGFDPDCPVDHRSGKCKCNKELVRIYHNVGTHYWLQEYGAEFTAREGKIYKAWSEEIHVRDDIKYNPAWENYIAFDFGFTDPFCCYDIMVDPMENVYVWREYQVRFKTTWEHAHYLKNRENPDGYHVNAAFADPRGPDEINTLQMVLSIPIAANAVGWSLGIEAVDRWMKIQPDGNPKLFISRNCPELIRQFGELQTPAVKEGKNAREGQKDFDDHGPDTIRYFFNERFVLRTTAHLEDVYGDAYKGSEAEGFFTTATSMTLDHPIGYR